MELLNLTLNLMKYHSNKQYVNFAFQQNQPTNHHHHRKVSVVVVVGGWWWVEGLHTCSSHCFGKDENIEAKKQEFFHIARISQIPKMKLVFNKSMSNIF